MYDVIIIGAAPAGLSAALYAARSGLKTLILEAEGVGGQISKTNVVDNYPGVHESITGSELTDRMLKQAERFHAEMQLDRVQSLELDGDVKTVKGMKRDYQAKVVILATGAKPKLMNVPGEKEYTGKGIGYCATCDAPFFEGMDIYVIGGGNSAVEEAIYLTRFGRSVTIIHRRDHLSAEKVIQEEAFHNEKIRFIWNSEVVSFSGSGFLTEMTLRDRVTQEITKITPHEEDMTFGVFIFIGYDPQSELVADKLENRHGYIVTKEDMSTSIPGLYVVGDIRDKLLRQVVTATADGAIAAFAANRYIESNQ